MKSIVLLILCTWSFHACQSQTSRLVHQRDYTIDCGLMGDYMRLDVLDTDSGIFMVTWNNRLFEISLFPLDTSRLPIRISLQALRASVWGSQERIYTYFHNADSIFVLPDLSVKVFLMDVYGAVRDSFDLSRPRPGSDQWYRPSAHDRAPMCFLPPYLYISLYVWNNDPPDPGANLFSPEKFPYHRINLFADTLRAEQAPLHWPAVYADRSIYAASQPMCLPGLAESMLYTFPGSPVVYKVTDHTQVDSVVTSGRHFGRFPPYDKERAGRDLQYYEQYHYERPDYMVLVYDRYRRLYYRAYRPATKMKIRDDMRPDMGDRPWYLLVLDEDFTVLDEIKMDEQIYAPWFILPASEGLWIGKRKENAWDNVFDFTLFSYQAE